MTNRKTTRRALVLSLLALLLCCSMLVGTTFAWFTDSVTSGKNVIIAGNLDVELYHSDKAVEDEKVDANTELFDDITLWEPGVVAWENLTVANEGTLALKYQLAINFDNAVGEVALADALKVAFIKGGLTATTREDAIAKGNENGWQDMASFKQEGTLLAGTTAPTTDSYGIVIYWEPTANDNTFNMNNGNKGKALSIDLGVILVATQLEAEFDSFDNKYDEESPYPVHEPISTSDLTPTASTGWGLEEGQTGHFFENKTFTNDAQIIVDSSVGVFFKDCKFANDGDMVVLEQNPVIYFEGCDFTVEPGQFIVTSEATAYQVFFVNCTLNGEPMTTAGVTPYMNNIGWFQAVEL